MFTCLCVCIHVCVCVFVCVCLCVCVCVCVCVCLCVCVCMSVCVCVCAHVCLVYLRTYACICALICTKFRDHTLSLYMLTGVAKLLLEYGAGINTHSNEFKESALTLACYKGM